MENQSSIVLPPPIQQKEVSRRDFNRFLLASALSVLATKAVTAVDLFGIPELSLGKYRQLVDIGENRMVGLVLGAHDRLYTSGVSKIERSDYFEPVSSVFVDSNLDYLQGGLDSVLKNLDNFTTLVNFNDFDNVLWKEMLPSGTPIILGDAIGGDTKKDPWYENYGSGRFNEIQSKIIGLMGAGLVVLGMVADTVNPHLTRRDFLKSPFKLAGVGTAIDILAFSDNISRVGRSLGIVPNTGAARDFEAIFTDLVNPNNFSLVSRNIVWALKIRDLYDQGIFPQDQIINILGGYSHKYVEFFLKNPEVAKKYFKTMGYSNIIKEHWKYNSEWVYTSLVYKYKGESKYVTHEGMKDLLN